MPAMSMSTINLQEEALKKTPQPRAIPDKWIFFLCVAQFVLVTTTVCFLLDSTPKDGPNDYCRNQTTMDCSSKIPVFAGRLSSNSWFSRDLDYDKVGMCLGHGLLKRNYHLLNYAIEFGRNENCKKLCSQTFEIKPTDWIKETNELSNCVSDDARQIYTLTNAIKDNYEQQLNIDDMPVVWCTKNFDSRRGWETTCKKQFPIGCYVDKQGHRGETCVLDSRFSKWDTYYLFNHLEFVINYNEEESRYKTDGEGDGRITSIKVTPKSVDHNYNCGHSPMAIPGSLAKTRLLNITYSYSVSFVKDNSRSWGDRRFDATVVPGRTAFDRYWSSAIVFVAALMSIFVSFFFCVCSLYQYGR